MTARFREEQEKYIFPVPQGMPLQRSALRTTPNVGTNISSVFGESALAVLDLSEEELELLADLRIVPEALLSKHMSTDAFRTLEQSKQELISRSNACARSIETLTRTRLRALGPERLSTLLRVSLAERKAGKNMAAFCGFCKGLRSRLSQLDRVQHADVEVFFEQMEMILEKLANVQSFAVAAEAFFGNVAQTQEIEQLYSCYTLLSPLDYRQSTPDITKAHKENKHLREFYSNLCSQEISASGGTHTLLEHMLGGSESVWQATLHDLDIYRYLLGIDTQREINESEMLELMYSYMHDTLSQNLCVTPPELALQSLLAERFENLSSCLLLGGLLSSYFLRFDTPEHMGMLYGVSESFRVLGRIGHLLGIRAGPVYLDLAQLCEQSMPYLTAEESETEQSPEEKISEAIQIVTENESLRCWSYLDRRKPWLPNRVRASLNFVGPYSLVRSDIVLATLRSSDLWRDLRWAGVDLDALSDAELKEACIALAKPEKQIDSIFRSTISAKLVECVMDNAKSNPAQSASLIVALLGVSNVPKPLYFNREIDSEIINLETPATEPTVGGELSDSDEEWPDLEL